MSPPVTVPREAARMAAPAPAIRAPAPPGAGSAAAASPAAAGMAVPPHIYIGTVEVRGAAPPVPPAPQAVPRVTAPAPAGPIARGYAWRFGLVQG
jgi:hypothetical protein